MTRYFKTSRLASARTRTGLPYKGQKALVIKAIMESGKPLTAEEILSKMRALYLDRLKGGNRGFVMTKFYGGGERGLIESVKYHLKELLKKDFITSSEC